MEKVCNYESTESLTIECLVFNVSNDYKFGILFILLSLIIVYTISVNLTVLFSILMDRLRNRLDICFISNAFSDFLIGVFVLPIIAIYSLFGFIPLNDHLCSAWMIFELTIRTTSMFHFTYISYDRYLSVLKPVKYSSNNRHSITYIILSLLYLTSALFWAPLILFLKSKNSTKPNMFSLSNQTNTSDTEVFSCRFELIPSIIIPHSILIFYMPMVMIFAFYSKTIHMLNRKIRRRTSYSVPSGNQQNFSNSDDYSEDSRFSSFKKITRGLLNQMSKRKSCQETSVIKQIAEANLKLTAEEYSINNKESSQIEPESVFQFDSCHKSITIDNQNSRVKIFIKCKHFSDLTISNFGEQENSFTCVECNFQKLNTRKNTIEPIDKRSAQSLNDIHDFNISDEPNLTHSDKKTRSLTEFRFNSVEVNNSVLPPKTITPISIAAKNLIKNIAKKKIKFSSVQSIKNKKLSSAPKTEKNFIKTERRKSEINPNDITTRSRRKSLTQREKTITYKLGFIMLVAILSWLPFAVLWPLSSLCLQCIPKQAYLIALWLAYVNSLLSPLILISSNSKYSLFINRFKNARKSVSIQL